MRTKLFKVRDKLSRKRKDSVLDASRTESLDSSVPSTQPSLLGLPAEIRNDIYEYLADSTTLRLVPTSGKKRPPPVGLLLACKQTWREYRAILLTRATFVIPVHNYHFGVVVRTFELMNRDDLSLMKLNASLWLYLQMAHVPSRDDRKSLRAWCDYRRSSVLGSYFGTGARFPRDIVFQYNVRFMHQMRPPRPASRYVSGFEMKLDLLRTHIRMASRLQTPEEEPSLELQKLREDLGDLAKILEQMSADLDAGHE